MPEVNVAIVGCGRMGRRHAMNLVTIADVKIVALIDSYTSAATSLAEDLKAFKQDAKVYSELSDGALASCTAVLIVTTTAMHAPLIKLAAKAGKHIFCEKPICSTVQEAEECEKLVEESGTILHMGFMRRYDTDIKAVQEVVAGGELGKVQMVRVRSFDGILQPMEYYRTSGGIFLDMAIHDIDVIRFVAASKVTSVSVNGSVTVDNTFSDFKDVDTATISLNFQNGAIGTIELLRFAPYGHDTQVEVIGEKGSVQCGPNTRNTLRVATKSGYNHGPLMEHVERFLPTFKAEMEGFAEAVRTGKPDPNAANARDGVESLKIAIACGIALEEGRKVALSR